jgi:hypothetical protein
MCFMLLIQRNSSYLRSSCPAPEFESARVLLLGLVWLSNGLLCATGRLVDLELLRNYHS